VVSEGSCGACFLGSEGAAVRGRLGYHAAERHHGGRPHDDTAWEAYIQWYTPRTHSRVMYIPPQPLAPVPDAARALVSSAVYPVRRDQHYDAVVSLKIHRLFLMVLYILEFTNNFFCSST
jgi:hypothetical protein